MFKQLLVVFAIGAALAVVATALIVNVLSSAWQV